MNDVAVKLIEEAKVKENPYERQKTIESIIHEKDILLLIPSHLSFPKIKNHVFEKVHFIEICLQPA